MAHKYYSNGRTAYKDSHSHVKENINNQLRRECDAIWNGLKVTHNRTARKWRKQIAVRNWGSAFDIDSGNGNGRRSITQSVLSVSSLRCFAKSPDFKKDEEYDTNSDATDGPLTDIDLEILGDDDSDGLGLPWPTQPAIFEHIYAATNGGSDRLERICVFGQLHRSTFQSVDGEYVMMNRRLSHHGKPVWYVLVASMLIVAWLH